MIPSIVKLPVSLAQQATMGAVRLGLGGATALLRTVRPGGDDTGKAPEPRVTPEARVTPPQPRVSTEPVTQPPSPPVKETPTPGATTTFADPAPATATPATVAAATKATAKKAPTKKAPAKKATAKQAPPKKAPAKKAAPVKPAATLDEPVAPVDDAPVVYSSGPEVAASVPTDDLEAIRSEL